MTQQKIAVFRSGWILILLFYSSLLYAQPYSGGNNSGASALNTATANCTLSRYFGGTNAGSTTIATTLLNCTTGRFWGDTADGAGTAKTNIQNCSTERFSGDTAYGSSAVKTNLNDCTNNRFVGDTSSGAKAVATNLLNCTNQRFYGDTADGFASAKYLLIRDFLGNDTSVTIICNSDTYNLLNLYTTPANLSYNWSSPVPTASGLGIFRLVATNQSGCKDTAFATVKQEIATWTGAISNNWHDAANWNNNKIPDAITHVIILGNTANPCQIKDADAVAASVQARAAGSFSIINNHLLLISGNCASLPTGL